MDGVRTRRPNPGRGKSFQGSHSIYNVRESQARADLAYRSAPKRVFPSGLSLAYLFRQTSERGYLIFSWSYWIPADAGMTESESPVLKPFFQRPPTTTPL